jgi:hypothetical protein
MKEIYFYTYKFPSTVDNYRLEIKDWLKAVLIIQYLIVHLQYRSG